ncbi:Leukotriene A-4 hydrolase [Homalodisca vitripennis]|nr:Leukotriene A-4 hydrolase [Homalodisca vitripennis]
MKLNIVANPQTADSQPIESATLIISLCRQSGIGWMTAGNPVSSPVNYLPEWLLRTLDDRSDDLYNTSLADACTALTNRWVQWDMTEPNPFTPTDLTNFHPLQVQEFLAQLLELESFPLDKVQALQSVYSFSASNNSEIKFRWLRLCIKVRWEEKVAPALQFVTEQGRMKFVRPIYRDLYAWEDMRQRTIDNFQATKANMMAVLVHNVAKDLHLE